MSILDSRIAALVLTAVAVAHGTIYSVQNFSFLNTSDPFLTSQPHHLAATHRLASKRSFLNVVFLKWAWAWTSLAFLLLSTTSPVKRTRRWLQWAFATGAWFILASWFFGPSLLTRLTAASGGVCGLHIGEALFVPIPQTYCSTGIPVSRLTHPELFPVVYDGAGADSNDPFIPRLRFGHDVSGHVFLLTLSVLFLADQLRQTRASARLFAIGISGALLSLWVYSLWVTSIYFHLPSEKISGFSASLPHLISSQFPIINRILQFWELYASTFLKYRCGCPQMQLYDTPLQCRRRQRYDTIRTPLTSRVATCTVPFDFHVLKCLIYV